METRYYLRMEVNDKPRVLGQIATRLGEFDVSLTDMEMRVKDAAASTGEIVFLTHTCRECSFKAATEALEAEAIIRRIDNWIRVEG